MHRRLWVLGLVIGCEQSVEPADSGQGDTDDTGMESAEPCSGKGSPQVHLGSGGRTNFVEYEEGDPLNLNENSSGVRGFWLEALIEGIDMREPVNVVYRVQIDGGPTDDYLTRVGLVCDDLDGWTKGFLEFDESVDTEALDGASLGITAVFTNDAGDAASGEVGLVGSPTW